MNVSPSLVEEFGSKFYNIYRRWDSAKKNFFLLGFSSANVWVAGILVTQVNEANIYLGTLVKLG